MKTLGIIELFHHHELVRPLLARHGLESLILWVSEEVKKHLFPQNIPPNVFVKTANQSISEFLDQHLSNMATCDQLIITTMPDHFKAFSSFDWPAATLLIIHNANAFFNPNAIYFEGNWKDRLVQLGRIIYRLGWKRDRYFRKQILKKIDHFAFVDSELTRHITIPPDLTQKLIKGPDFYYREEKKTKRDNKNYNVVFPGRVDLARKDYAPHLQRLLHFRAHFPLPLTLIFLGPIKGKKEVIFLHQWKARFPPNIQLITFPDTIPQVDYNNYLLQADLLVLPLKQTVRFSIYKEVLGKTKISGGIHDGLRYNTTTLVPDFYPIREEFMGVVIAYSQWWRSGLTP